ncbi:unnamed protein product, partial [Oikopleura dioica]
RVPKVDLRGDFRHSCRKHRPEMNKLTLNF